jgi:hypothetical protein
MDQLRKLAQEEGLHFAHTGAPEPQTPAITRLGRPRVEGIARGLLPDDTAAAITVLAYPGIGADGTLRRITMCAFLQELPESAERLPWLAVRNRETEPGGLLADEMRRGSPPVRPLDTESAFFAQRFDLEGADGTDENMVRRLFAPAFLHWFAYETPFGFSCEIALGTLSAYVIDEPDRPGRLKSVWDAGSRVAMQVRYEAAGG